MADEIENGGAISRLEEALMTVSEWTGIPVDALKKVVGLGALGIVAIVGIKLFMGRR